MTFSRCWNRGFVQLINRYVGSEDFPDLLEYLEHEVMTAADHDPELTAIYECSAMAKALKDIAERDDIRSREVVRCINTAVTSAKWLLDDLNSWAFKMVKGSDGKWVMQGVAFEQLKMKGVKTHG